LTVDPIAEQRECHRLRHWRRAGHGGKIALGSDVIERNVDGRDERPGSVPDIRCEGDSVVYTLTIPGLSVRLIIRCDPDGTVCTSVTTSQSP
jgi:hypothetical protein